MMTRAQTEQKVYALSVHAQGSKGIHLTLRKEARHRHDTALLISAGKYPAARFSKAGEERCSSNELK